MHSKKNLFPMKLVLFSILLKYYIKIYISIRKNSKGLSLCLPVNILSAHSILNKPIILHFFWWEEMTWNPGKEERGKNGAIWKQKDCSS